MKHLYGLPLYGWILAIRVGWKGLARIILANNEQPLITAIKSLITRTRVKLPIWVER
jgi:hypothetical protein